MLALILSLALTPQSDADWPTFRHDAARSGRTTHSLSWGQMQPQWSKSFGRPQAAWPGPAQWDAFAALPGLKSMRDYDSAYHSIAVGDSVYFGSNSVPGIQCLHATDGSEAWFFSTPAPVRVAPTYADGHLYFGDDSGTAYCLNSADGNLVWKYSPHQGERLVVHDGRFISFAPIRTGVLVRDGVAYFGASFLPWKSSYLYAVHARTGKAPTGALAVGESKQSGKSFARNLGAGWTLEGPMLLSERNLIMPQGRVSPLVFARKDGTPQGTLEGGGGSFCLLTDDEQILHGPGNKTGWITASDADGRAKIASYDKGNAIVVDGSTAYLLSDRGLTAFDRSSQALIWSRPVDTPYTLIQAGAHLIAGGDGVVRVFEAESGEEIWAASVPGKALGLVAAQQRLLVSTDSGHIVGFGRGESKWSGAEFLAWHTSAPSSQSPPPIAKSKDRKLIDHWLFQSNAQEQVEITPGDPRTTTVFANLGQRKMAARPLGASSLQQQGEWSFALLDGGQGDLEVGTLQDGVELPKRKFSAEAWVRVDKAAEWGGIVGAAQDNGEYERGWLLGYRKNQFSFALKAKKGNERLSWVRAPQSFRIGGWHHVVGTYDGKLMQLFVDGELAAEGEGASGDVDYPEVGWYQLGAYRDKDEYFRLKGGLHEVKLHNRVLKPADVRKAFEAKADHLPAPIVIEPPRKLPVADLELLTQPWIRLYDGNHAAGSTVEDQLGYADVSWSTSTAKATEIEFLAAADVPGPDGKFPLAPASGWKEMPPLRFEVIQQDEQVHPGHQHTVRIHGLPPRSVQHFRVVSRHGNQVRRSKIFELDTHFSQAALPADQAGSFFDDGDRLLQTLKFYRAPVIAVFGEAMTAQQTERMLSAAVGADIHQLTLEQLKQLPPMSVDVVVVNQLPKVPMDQVARVVAPFGMWFDTTQRKELPDGFEHSLWKGEPKEWICYRKQLPRGSGEWSHLYGSPDNSAYGGESLAGATTVDDMEVQWVAPPGPRYQTDRQNRRPAPLAKGGKLYLQGKDRILCLNSFNGQTQWAWELPGLNRFNMPRDCSNWCVGKDSVFVAIDGYCWQLNVKDGRKEIALSATDLYNQGLPEAQHETMNWGYVARLEGDEPGNDLLLGSAVRPGNTFTDWWGGTYWYDAREGSATAKVCSDALFALSDRQHEASKNLDWTYRGGLILNTTITVADDTIYFLENRSPELRAKQERRFAGAGLFEDLHMVALNLKDGTIQWQREAKPLPGDVAVFLAASEGRLVLVTSHKNPSVGEQGGEFAVYSFNAKNGDSQWRRKFTWEMDHHGKSISRPAIVGGHIYLRPLVLDLNNGDIIRQSFPSGHQCGSYAAAEHALFLRCGNLSAWSREDWTASGWERLRPDCWISTIPANGMLLSPEGGGGCSCGSWMETSLGFLPVAADPNAN